MKMHARVVTVVAAILALAAPAMAALTAYEYFDYPTNPTHILNQSGGYGWGSAWTWSGGTPAVVGGYIVGWLTNTAYPFIPVGGFVRCDNAGVWPTRSFASPIDLSVNSNYYFSFLISVYEQKDDNNQIEFLHYGTQANIRVGLRNNSGQLAARVVCGSGTQGLLNGFYLRSNYFFVGKIQTSASGNDYMRLNVYKDGDAIPTSEPGTWDVSSTGAAMNGIITNIQLRHGTVNNDQLPTMYDEIRFGETWTDVALPEPVGLGVVLVALGLVRRRR